MTQTDMATSRRRLGRIPLYIALTVIFIGCFTVFLWRGRSPSDPITSPQASNYARYLQANLPDPLAYPWRGKMGEKPEQYHAVAPWSGRLVLPSQTEAWPHPAHNGGQEWVWLELHHAPEPYDAWEGQLVRLQWVANPAVQAWVTTMARPLTFSPEAIASQNRGMVHPTRLNGWPMVGPLQSLAGARSRDDVMVRLEGPIVASPPSPSGDDSATPVLQIEQMPTQIGGQWSGLVKILGPAPPPSDAPASLRYFQVQHFAPQTQHFDGAVEVVGIPESIPDGNGIPRTSLDGIERSPLNHDGWYIYGNFVADFVSDWRPTHGTNQGTLGPQRFVVQALEPRAMVRFQPSSIITNKTAAKTYIYTENLNPATVQQNTASTVWVRPLEPSLTNPIPPPAPARNAIASLDMTALMAADWQEGDRALVIHLFGGIGGEQGESSLLGITPGHFSFGTAEVVQDSLSQQLRFEITHHQVYAHNPDGIVSGSVQWAEYMGNVQRGWQGTRPISDVVIQFPPVTQDYDFDGEVLSPFDTFVQQLTLTMARYRIGDGTGASTLSPITSCVQDSNQALYATIKQVEQQVQASPTIQQWLANHPDHPQTIRFQQLIDLGLSLERQLVPLGMIRRDWQQRLDALPEQFQSPGMHHSDQMLTSLYTPPELSGIQADRSWSQQRQILMALSSWRTVLPRRSHDELASILLEHGAQLWFIRTNQIGGENPAIAPRVPNTFLGS